MEILIILTAMLAGIIQGITGFGAGIVMMMLLPMYFPLPQSAGISTAIISVLCLSMVYIYRKHICLEKILGPSILYLIICSLTIYFSTMADQILMKKVFGLFLIILACYYLLINKNDERKKINLAFSLFCIVISAICDGLFGVGGPLMVVYFLSCSHHTHEYLGTIQTFFCINSLYNTTFRVIHGILGLEHLAYIIMGIGGIIIGGFIASRIVDKLNGYIVRKLTYMMIGISGIINLF